MLKIFIDYLSINNKNNNKTCFEKYVLKINDYIYSHKPPQLLDDYINENI
jgi:hypothetical protein